MTAIFGANESFSFGVAIIFSINFMYMLKGFEKSSSSPLALP